MAKMSVFIKISLIFIKIDVFNDWSSYDSI